MQQEKASAIGRRDKKTPPDTQATGILKSRGRRNGRFKHHIQSYPKFSEILAKQGHHVKSNFYCNGRCQND